MRLNLWLAQPETERKLATSLRLVLIAFACWAVAVAYGLWSTRSAVAASQSAVVSQGKKIDAAAQGLPSRQIEAANAAHVKIAASASAASADLTDELSRIAQVAGVQIAGVRIGETKQGEVTIQSSPAAASPKSASSVVASTPADDAWEHEEFECNVAGDYHNLTQFLNVLAASNHVLDITAVDVTQVGANTKTGGPRLEMKLSGIVYELPGKS